MDDRFVVRIGARGYEVDANGHVSEPPASTRPASAGRASGR